MYGRKRDGFYNLRVNSNPSITNSDRSCFEVKIDNNTIDLTVTVQGLCIGVWNKVSPAILAAGNSFFVLLNTI